jgi:hypothetical protein
MLTDPMQQIYSLMAETSCEQIRKSIEHFAAVNEILNKQDPATLIIIRRTISTYLDILDSRCSEVNKKKGPRKRP